MVATKNFLKDYFKRYGVLAAVLSVACLFTFCVLVIPPGVVASTDSFEYTQKLVSGVHPENYNKTVVHNASVPRNAAGETLIYIGDLKVTHYCACTICTWGSGITASGKPVAVGMIAADWKVLPKETTVYVKSGDSLLEKVVEDRGGAINGNIIDIYVQDHGHALALGVYTAELYVDPGTILP